MKKNIVPLRLHYGENIFYTITPFRVFSLEEDRDVKNILKLIVKTIEKCCPLDDDEGMQNKIKFVCEFMASYRYTNIDKLINSIKNGTIENDLEKYININYEKNEIHSSYNDKYKKK